MRRITLLSIIIFITLGLIWSNNLILSQEKAVLSLKPSSGSIRVGEIIQVEVMVDTKGNAINSARGIIEFDPAQLEVLDLGKGKSIFVFWDPSTSFSNSTGEITFGGGLPSPGFSGSSALILKPSFKARKAGKANIHFKEGSVLANDAEGTDILGKLEGASYKIEREQLPTPVETPAILLKITPPQITTYPAEISSTEVFYCEGSGLAQTTVLLYIEKENEEPVVKEVNVSPDGSWSYVHEKFLQAGEYSIYAKTKTGKGEISSSSEKANLSVTRGALQIGGFSIRNETLYGIIILILITGVIILLGIFATMQYRGMRERRKLEKEIREADQSVVKGFDTLKTEVRRELSVLKELKITDDRLSSKARKERRKILDDLLEDLDLLDRVEKIIQREVKDIEDILPS